MTNEFKINILKYLTGKLKRENGNNIPLIHNIVEYENNLVTFIKQYYPGLTDNGWAIGTLINRGDYIILWFNDFDNNGWKKSFVVVTNKDYVPLHYIDTYSSGTPLGSLTDLNTNDSGSGNIIGIEYVYDSSGNVVNKRISIINDFTLTNFQIRLLSSFNIPKYNNNDITISQITKNPNSGRYFLIYYYSNSSGNYLGGALEFVNNVGSANEWNFYPYTGPLNIIWTGAVKGIPNWTDDTLEYKILCDYNITMDSRGNTTALAVLKQSVVDDTRTTINDRTISLPSECINVGQIAEIIIEGNLALVSTITTSSSQSQTKYVIQFNLNDGASKIWYLKEDYVDNTLPGTGNYEISFDEIRLLSLRGQFYFFRTYIYERYENFELAEYYDNVLYLDQIFNDNIYEYVIQNFEQQDSTVSLIHTNNVYNLNEFTLFLPTYILKVKQVFNSSNYNGLSYENINSVLPNSGILYDDNEELVFARNLYNKTISDRTTQSTIQVPANYLNDITIARQDLISETNSVLVDSTNSIEKNIYETLFINFINTLQMINKNDLNNQVLNPTGAIRLNRSISQVQDYTAQTLNKAKINYEDGAYYVIPISFEPTGSVMQTTFTINPTKEITNIELISNDEETIYNTITGNFEINKTYTISQDVTIEGIENLAELLYYNNEIVRYDNEDIQIVN